jgi:hypothetical protein
LALIAGARWRVDRLAAAIGRLDARARICVLLVDLYDRLRRHDLITRLSYNRKRWGGRPRRHRCAKVEVS